MTKYSHPFSLRLTFTERARLETDAAGMSLAAYIKWRVFDPDKPPPRTRGKFPVKDHQALAQLAGKLGQSHLSNNINQLAKAVNMGTLEASPETEARLLDAAVYIAEMRGLLVRALGLEDGP